MTDKQEKCVQWICETLDIKYDRPRTKCGAYRFIRDYYQKALEKSKSIT